MSRIYVSSKYCGGIAFKKSPLLIHYNVETNYQKVQTKSRCSFSWLNLQ
jgi:hypothetical protein